MDHAQSKDSLRPLALCLFLVLLMMICVGACGATAIESSTVATKEAATTVDPRCVFKTAPTVVKQAGNATLEVWQFEDEPVLGEIVIPPDAALAAYRQTIIASGADVIRPVADKPRPKTAEDKELWRREAKNAEAVFSGHAGRVRAIQCLEALVFARHNARYSQITHPTEFIASVLRKTIKGRIFLKLYFAGSDQMFPPKEFYGFDEAESDVRAGWSLWFVLHNHPIQKNDGRPALGTPTLSTSDVDLHRALAKRLGLQSARVTNGFFTAEIPATAFHHYLGRRPDRPPSR